MMNKPTQSGYYEDVRDFCLGQGVYEGNNADYADALPRLATEEMVTFVGMALENANIGWGRGEEQEYHDTIESCEAAYFEAAFQEATGEYL